MVWYKMFQFIKKAFFLGLTNLSDFTNASFLNAIPLSCISMKNPECKTRPQAILMLMEMNLCFFHLALKQVNTVVAVIILTIRTQKFVFLAL